MKEKGFTLIELLAVIVILAIIALIAVPIILNIIEDARNESNERSVELYGTAVKNAAAKYQLGKTNKNITGKYTSTNGGKTLTLETDSEVVLTVDYEGAAVECTTVEIFANGQVSLADCEVSGKPVNNTYGDVEDDKTEEGNEGETPGSGSSGENGETGSTQVYKPQYYSWTSSGSIGGDLPSDATENVSELDTKGYPFYLGLDVDGDNKVTAAYSCFTRNGTEYCLKYGEYATNQDILEEAFKDVENACSLEENYSFKCIVDDLHVYAFAVTGEVNAGYGYPYEGDTHCYVNGDGYSMCRE